MVNAEFVNTFNNLIIAIGKLHIKEEPPYITELIDYERIDAQAENMERLTKWLKGEKENE